jgi:hypothetical protein
MSKSVLPFVGICVIMIGLGVGAWAQSPALVLVAVGSAFYLFLLAVIIEVGISHLVEEVQGLRHELRERAREERDPEWRRLKEKFGGGAEL